MYTIKVLSSKEFDSLPKHITRGSDISDSLGFADRVSNTAYVRHTAHEDLTKYLIDHEFEHLLEDNATHEDENGIRHKKFRQMVGQAAPFILPFVPGIGPAAGGAIGGALRGGIGGDKRSFSGALKGGAIGGATGYAAKKFLGDPSTAFSQGGARPASGFAQSAKGSGTALVPRVGQVGGLTGGQLSGGVPTSIFDTFSNTVKGTFGNIGNTFKNLFGGKSAFASPGTPQLPGAPGGGTPPIVPGAQSSPASSGNTNSVFDFFTGNVGKSLLGAGSLAMGLGRGFPEVPDLPQSINDLRAKIQGGGSDLGRLGGEKLTEQLGQTFEGLSAEEEAAITRDLDYNYQQELDALNDLYKNIRPGTDPSTDSAYQRDLADINDRYARLRSDTLATARRDLRSEFNQQQALAIQQALGASSEEMNQLASLAQLDLEQIMAQLNLDYQSALLFKETFLNLGSSLFQSAFQPDYSNFLNKIFS